MAFSTTYSRFGNDMVEGYQAVYPVQSKTEAGKSKLIDTYDFKQNTFPICLQFMANRAWGESIFSSTSNPIDLLHACMHQ